MKCIICGKSIPDDSKRCEHCGHPYGEEERRKQREETEALKRKQIEALREDMQKNKKGCVVIIVIVALFIGALIYGCIYFL